ncbi:MAG: TetR family transcriptional regulator [Parcubacteria group bacterium]|nr:TetR family transcriptional regulator [Parcubacteria group bacterium]
MDATVPKRETMRTLAKRRTREKVLSAARTLFAERGFEGATIRDIAWQAEMSTGAVFASFDSKGELFAAVLESDLASLRTELRTDLKRSGSASEDIQSFLTIIYRHYASRLPFLYAKLGAMWHRDPNLEKFFSQEEADFRSMCVESLIAKGLGNMEHEEEVNRACGLAQLLWSVHIGNLRLLARKQLSLDNLLTWLSFHIKTVLHEYR